MLFSEWLASATVLDVFCLATVVISAGIALERSALWLSGVGVKRGS